MNVFLIGSAALIFLYVALSFYVSGLRQRRRNDKSSVSENQLNKAIRAHGNSSEYIPLFIMLFLYSDFSQLGIWASALAILGMLSRLSHAAGMLLVENSGDRHPLRFCGAIGTYACLLLFGILLLYRGIWL